MPDKNELIAELNQLSEKLGINSPKPASKYDDLAKQVSDLKQAVSAKAKAEKEVAEAEAAKVKAKKETAEAEESVKAPGYYVCSGQSVTTKKGLKSEGEMITAEMVGGGEDSLKYLTKVGCLKHHK